MESIEINLLPDGQALTIKELMSIINYNHWGLSSVSVNIIFEEKSLVLEVHEYDFIEWEYIEDENFVYELENILNIKFNFIHEHNKITFSTHIIKLLSRYKFIEKLHIMKLEDLLDLINMVLAGKPATEDFVSLAM